MARFFAKLKNQKVLAGFFIVVNGFLFALLLHISGVLTPLEMKTVDVRMQLSDKNTTANKDIVVVLVDEASLKSMKKLVGRWPWPRSVFAELVGFFSEAGARAVLFDVLFTEPQVPRSAEGELGEDDFNLVDTTMQSENTIHAAQFLLDTEDEINKTLLNQPLPEMYKDKYALDNIQIKKGVRLKPTNMFYLPFKELYEVADQVGIVEFSPDSDGIYRRSHLIRRYQNDFFPVLSLAMIGKMNPPEQIILEQRQLTFGDKKIPLQKDGTYLINMKKDFVTFSIGGILATINQMNLGEYENMLFQPDEFKDKIIIIGASAAGIEDLKHATTGSDVPGVLLHASIISNLMDQDYIKEGSELWLFVLVFIACIIITIGILGFHSLAIQSIFPIVFTLLFIGSGHYLLDYYRILIPIVAPIVAFSSVFVGSFVYVSATEGKERRKTRKMLSQYVSPHVLSEVMDKSQSVLTPEVGTTEELSILFSDIRSFTSFSEMVAVDQVVKQLNYYLSEMVEAVFMHQGTLDKFIGDAVMAFWGAPIISKTHARQSTMAALEMVKKLKEVNQYFDDNDYPNFKIGIGIHTGNVILGNIGSEKKLDYTIIGDSVNLASRIEGLTKNYGCEILITETTYDYVKDEIPCRVIDAVRVKGKEKPIRIYNPLVSPEDSEDIRGQGLLLAEKSEAAFNNYQGRNWEIAIQQYEEIRAILVDDVASNIVIMRCQEFLSEPPPSDWDGCYTMKTK